MQISDEIYYKYINFNIVNNELKWNSSMGGKGGTLADTYKQFQTFQKYLLIGLAKS